MGLPALTSEALGRLAYQTSYTAISAFPGLLPFGDDRQVRF
jgi:hypothetical protein